MSTPKETPKKETDTHTVPDGFDSPTGPFAGRPTGIDTPTSASAPTEESAERDTPSTAPDQGHEDHSARIIELEARLADMKDQALRAMAEADNIRKRSEREHGNMRKYAITGFAKDLLNVSDNLRRALEAVPTDSRAENETLSTLLTGVEATERELLKIFEQQHIKQISPLGEKFDPNFHEVMFEAPSSDYPANIVLQVIEVGYVIHDRILRPARVGVSKGTPEAPQPEDGTPDHHIDQEA